MELDDDYANSVRFARLSRTVFKKPSDKHYLSPNAPRICSLDSCNVGKQTLSPGQTLKYCTGCYLVMYCVYYVRTLRRRNSSHSFDKQCRDHQIEDRKGHKSFCIHAANKSPDVLLQLLNDWIHLHMMAIETAASYAIEFPVPYDVERYFWAVYMEYLPNKGGNPATSFRIVKTKMMGFDDTHPDCASPRQFRNENPIEDGDRDIGLCAPDRRGGVVVQCDYFISCPLEFNQKLYSSGSRPR